MKKLSILLLTGTLLCLSGGCDSYRNRDTRIAISYLCVGQDDMFELYDITATYSDGKGRVHTSPVTSFPWKVEYSYMPLGVHAQLEINFQPKPHIVRKESYTVGCNAYINWDCLQGGGENYSETDCYKISAEEVDAFLNNMDRKIAEGKYKLKKSFNYE